MKKHIISIRKLTAPAIFISLVFLYLTPCYAKQVTLAWNASPGAAGYKIYYKTGRPGPPYNGTGATRNYSPQVFNSPIVIGASRRATIHVPDGTYRFALTAYNKYGESDYSTEVLAEYSSCKFQKVEAAKNLCTRLLSDHSNVITAPDEYDLNSLVRSAEAEFESLWEEAEAIALINGEVCPTASMEYIGDRIVLAVEDIVLQISDGLDLESLGGRDVASYLVKEVQEQCIRSFENEAYEIFPARWNWYISWGSQWRVIYSGPPSSDIEGMIDTMVTDVLAEIL